MKRVFATLSVIAAITAAAVVTSINMASGAAPTVSVGPSNYSAVTPCRIADTRAHDNPLAINTTRDLVVAGTTGFAAQGGNATGCSIPSTASAVTVSLSAVIPAGPGYLRAWPAGTTPPTATVLNYAKGFNITTGATVPISSTGMTVEAFAGGTGIVVDVTGYYDATVAASVNAAGSLLSGTGILSASRLGLGNYVVTADHDLTGCVATVSTPNGTLANATIAGTTISVHLLSLAGLLGIDNTFNLGVLC
jgi:hypothetical protein